MLDMSTPVPSLALAVLVSVGAIGIDLRSGRVPNWLVLPAVPLGWLAAGLMAGWPGLGLGVLGSLLGAALLLLPWWRGWIGAGDLKLMAALGALAGPVFVAGAFVWGSLLGGLLLGVAARRAGASPKSVSIWSIRVPYGAALAAGALVTAAVGLPGGATVV